MLSSGTWAIVLQELLLEGRDADQMSQSFDATWTLTVPWRTACASQPSDLRWLDTFRRRFSALDRGTDIAPPSGMGPPVPTWLGSRLRHGSLQPKLLASAILLVLGCGGGDPAEQAALQDAGPPDGGPARSTTDCTHALEAAGWLAYSDEASTIDVRGVAAPGDRLGCAAELRYDIAETGHGGVERIYRMPYDWTDHAHLAVSVYAEGMGHPLRFELYDAEDERWEVTVETTWTGWSDLELPFADFTPAEWQPDTASIDGDFELRGVRGMAVGPSQPGISGTLWLGALTAAGEAPLPAGDSGT